MNDDLDDENRLRRGWPTGDGSGADGRGANGASAYQDEEEDEAPAPAGAVGRWVSHGGVLVWEESAEAPAQPASEAESLWAADELQLPPGAPAGARIRAVRAWLLAQRQAANEALGMLLLEQRRMQPAAEAEPPPARRGSREAPPEESPLELAMAEQQAAMSEYERLFETLADLETHIGPPRVLVEFYLSLTDQLAELANAPEAPSGFAPHLRTGERPAGAATARSAADWEGRASSVVKTRRRIERMTAPETEE
jgi:hypothetical protein